jgi:hypothetical protein
VRRPSGLLLSLLLAFANTACAGTQAYVEWRPGLSEIAFDGLFEIPLDEFESFAEKAEPNTILDRARSFEQPTAAQTLKLLSAQIRSAADPDLRGLAIVALDEAGNVSLASGQGRTTDGTVDWLAVSQDHRYAALLSETRLAVAIDGATTGIDIGSLIGSSVDGYQVLMLVRETELTVFVLPALGGVVTANQPGYLFEFRHTPTAREPWAVSVARIAIKL